MEQNTGIRGTTFLAFGNGTVEEMLPVITTEVREARSIKILS